MKLIAMEGIDGTGKTVQSKLLAKALRETGAVVRELDFPVYTSFFGGKVGEYLSGNGPVSAPSVDGKSMCLWFALDRFEYISSQDFKDVDFVIANRYVLSNVVYQSIRDIDLGMPDLTDFVLELEYSHFHIPVAAMNIVLDLDLDVCAQNVVKKGFRDYVGQKQDAYESLSCIQMRAREKYHSLQRSMKDVYIINCMGESGLRSIEDIHTEVFGLVKKILLEERQ